MPNYKDFDKVDLGFSDIASLVVRDANGVIEIHFGEDGSYEAYECYGPDVQIGEHYKLVYEAKGWLKIYDDERLVYNGYSSKYNNCSIYRAGTYGCILYWH